VYERCAIFERNKAEADGDDRFPGRRAAHQTCYVYGRSVFA
jgi:hypothetical protein